MLQKVFAMSQAWNALWNQHFALRDRCSELQLLLATSIAQARPCLILAGRTACKEPVPRPAGLPRLDGVVFLIEPEADSQIIPAGEEGVVSNRSATSGGNGGGGISVNLFR